MPPSRRPLTYRHFAQEHRRLFQVHLDLPGVRHSGVPRLRHPTPVPLPWPRLKGSRLKRVHPSPRIAIHFGAPFKGSLL